MKVGDLVKSKHEGYGTVIKTLQYGRERGRFVDILWTKTGVLRTCYPVWKLKVINEKM